MKHSSDPKNHMNGNHQVPTSETNGFSSLEEAEAIPKRSLSKRGKKKLTAMISRFNSSIHHQSGKSKSVTSFEQNNNDNNSITTTSAAAAAHDAVDETDEDEEFSEPLCQDDLDQYESELQQADTEMKTRTNGGQERKLSRSKSSEDHEEDEDNKNALMPEEDCDIPTFLHTKDCDKHLIERTRVLLRERFEKNPDNFYEDDYKRMLVDDWTVSRFLLRRRLDPKRTAKLMEECGRFRKQYKMSEVKLWEFPIEFHKAGGLFKYGPDRVGNLTVYMRVRMYRRVPEISDVFKAFILCVIEMADVENNGRGVAVVFDLSGCGLQNVDLSFLSWLLSSFRNYCPKGLSYIIVYNLPWILSTTCRVAMTWMSATNRRALRFVHGDEIENFIAKENLPDYCGGTCKVNYRAVPEGAKRATEVCDQLDITRQQALKIRELFKEYLSDDDSDIDEEFDENSNKKNKNKKKNKNLKKQSASLDVKQNDSALNNCDTPTKEVQEIIVSNSPSADFVSQASKFIT